jgi:UDP-3-O-[3-hydroxymyristoyl] glucosamine N-acyltransferase
VRELAAFLRAEYEGDGEADVTGAAPVEAAGPYDLSFASGAALARVPGSSAGCVIVPLDFINMASRTIVRVEHPRSAFAAALSCIYPPEPVHAGVHPTAVIAATASIDETCEIAPHVTVADGARLGPRTRVGAGCSIGRSASIGADCSLHANVTIYDDVEVGDRVILHSGAVLGADGFGFVLQGDRYAKFPQVGRVVVHDDVEVGANACIDRAALGVTEVGEGTKLDNMVHIGHNCRIGKHVVIAAQTGLSGGVVVEDYAVIGGQVGIGDKARIESGAILGSGCGVLTSKIVRSGEPVWGTPARPLRQHLEQLATVARLPKLRQELTDLKARIAQLERAP